MYELILRPSVLAKCDSFLEYFQKLKNSPTEEQSERGNSLHSYVEELLKPNYEIEKEIQHEEILGDYLIIFRGIVDAINENEIVEIKSYTNLWSAKKQTQTAIKQLTIYQFMLMRSQSKRLKLKVILVNTNKQMAQFYVEPDYAWLYKILAEIQHTKVIF